MAVELSVSGRLKLQLQWGAGESWLIKTIALSWVIIVHSCRCLPDPEEVNEAQGNGWPGIL